jgi:hypothetical protein
MITLTYKLSLQRMEDTMPTQEGLMYSPDVILTKEVQYHIHNIESR